MAKYLASALEKPNLEPYEISQTLRRQLHYLTEGTSSHRLAADHEAEELFFPLERTAELLEDGVFSVISPLDDQNQAEIEITAEQEDLLDWLVSNQIERVRISKV